MTKRSFIWSIPLPVFEKTILESNTWCEIAEKLYNRKANTKTIKIRAKQDGIDTTHLSLKCPKRSHPKYTLDSLLKKDQTHKIPNQRLKHKLVKNKLLDDRCYTCGLGDTWNSLPITLHLVHLNNNSYDNNLENIIIQCPNCYSQLKQKGVYIFFLDSCKICNTSIPIGSRKCQNCKQKKPTKKILRRELVNLGFKGVGLKYNITKDQIIEWINL